MRTGKGIMPYKLFLFVLITSVFTLFSSCGEFKKTIGISKSDSTSTGGGAAATSGGSSTTTATVCTGSGTTIDAGAIYNTNIAAEDAAVYFQSTITGYLNKVGLQVWQGSSGQTLLLFIRKQTSGNPNSDAIVSNGGLGQAIVLPAADTGGAVEYTLTSPVAITSGTRYWIHMVRVAAGTFNIAYRNANVKPNTDFYFDLVGLTGWDAPFSAKGCQ